RDVAAHHRHARVGPITAGQGVARAGGQFWRGLLDVGNIYDPTIENSGAGYVLAGERDRKPASNRFNAGGIGRGDRRRIDFVPIYEQDDESGAWKQLEPALDDRVEHRLGVAQRIADDAKNPGGRRLLLQRLAEIGRALAQLVEQPSI